MNTELSVPHVDDAPQLVNTDQTEEQTVKATWHAPTLTRINIKRTLSDAGSPIDGFGTGVFTS